MGSVSWMTSFVFPTVHLSLFTSTEHYISFLMVESSFIFKHCRGLSECTKCVLLWSSSLYFHQQLMGVCFGRSSSTKHDQVVHPFSPNKSTNNHQVHVIQKCLNPESKLQCYCWFFNVYLSYFLEPSCGVRLNPALIPCLILQGCRPIGKCRVNGRKYVKEVSSSILTPIYLCSMLAGCVAHLGL
jgi:hypothetical protein